jgi:16S rRNA (uracil1498-N3)-methyltransferase
MHRFFVAPELLSREASENVVAPLADARTMVSLPKPIAHQVRDVLHLAVGEQLLLLDNTGDEVLATVTASNRNTVDVQLLERRAGKSEPTIRIILCQGLLKSARFEWILEKGTELGVTVFAPTLCHRSMSGLEEAGSAKIQRWQRIIQEAAEQSGRSRLPQLLPICPLMHALTNIPRGALAIMPWEQEHNRSLHEALSIGLHSDDPVGADLSCPSPIYRLLHQPITVVLFIGPEGGLTTDEITLAQQHGVQPVTLGPRILRAETAALATIANVLYELA